MNVELDNLPTLPRQALKILHLDMEEEFDQLLLEKLIAQCPIISLRILNIANSSLYRSHRPVNSIKDALLRIGIKKAHSLAYSVAIYSQLNIRDESRFDMNSMWDHNIAVMQLMNKISKDMKPSMRPSDSDISLAAIMHDIGFIALDTLEPEKSDQFHSQNRVFMGEASLNDSDYFANSHAFYGGLMLKKFGMPENICNAVKNHHQRLSNSFGILTTLLQVADIYSSKTQNPDPGFIQEASRILKIDESTLLHLSPKNLSSIFV